MIAWAQRFLEGIHALPVWNVALFFAVCGMLQAFFPVFPGDIVLIIGAGVWTGGLANDLWPVLFSYWIGTTAASLALTEIGRSFGDYLLTRRWLRRVFPPRRQALAGSWLRRRGVLTIFAAKFIMGMNLPILMVCGILRMPRRRVYPAVILTTAIHNTLLYSLGSAVGLNWQTVKDFLLEYELVVALALAVIIGLAVWIRSKLSGVRGENP